MKPTLPEELEKKFDEKFDEIYWVIHPDPESDLQGKEISAEVKEFVNQALTGQKQQLIEKLKRRRSRFAPWQGITEEQRQGYYEAIDQVIKLLQEESK